MKSVEQLRADLAHLCPMLLPADARAASVEITGVQVTLRIYLHGPGVMERWEALDAQFEPLIARRLPADTPWQILVQAFRRDRPESLDVFGTLCWSEEGTVIASIDGRPVPAAQR